jgi:ABC-type nitrate/sulfonate/bicarbonate transport system permease component
MDYVMDGMIVIGIIGILLDSLMKKVAVITPSGRR